MLLEQLVQKTGIVCYHLLDGDARQSVGSGEPSGQTTGIAACGYCIFLASARNGHIAFNDPPCRLPDGGSIHHRESG